MYTFTLPLGLTAPYGYTSTRWLAGSPQTSSQAWNLGFTESALWTPAYAPEPPVTEAELPVPLAFRTKVFPMEHSIGIHWHTGIVNSEAGRWHPR